MRHDYYCPGRVFEERQAYDWQCQLQLVEVEREADRKAKEMKAYENAMCAAACLKNWADE